MIKKRFHYDYKTGRIKDTQSNSQATSNMRVLETIINDACYSYEKKIKELEKDVEYWKQVASQYSNELNVFEHCKKHKTECKDIYWDSD